MHHNAFALIQTPIITPLDCEGGGEAFTLSVPGEKQNDLFFKQQAYLGVSGQLYAEMAASSMSRVYTFGPTFRAEKSHTTRHLAEFWMFEPEMAFVNLQDIMNMAEICVKYSIEECLKQCPAELKFLQERYDKELIKSLQSISSSSFARISYTESIRILEEAIAQKKVKFEFPISWGESLSSEHERFLAEVHFKGPIFVTHYPRKVKAFYMKLDDNVESLKSNDIDTQTVACFDLLVPRIGELIGGSQREDRLEKLIEQITYAKLDPKLYEWYIDLRKFGSIPHGGFGLGFERLLLLMTGMANIRDVIAVPRPPGTMKF
jgi:asparaginyl-tRNA synthetase